MNTSYSENYWGWGGFAVLGADRSHSCSPCYEPMDFRVRGKGFAEVSKRAVSCTPTTTRGVEAAAWHFPTSHLTSQGQAGLPSPLRSGLHPSVLRHWGPRAQGCAFICQYPPLHYKESNEVKRMHILSTPQPSTLLHPVLSSSFLELNHRHQNAQRQSDLRSCNTNSSLRLCCCSRQHRRRSQRTEDEDKRWEGKIRVVLGRWKSVQFHSALHKNCPTSPINVPAAFQSCICSPATRIWAPATTDLPLDSRSYLRRDAPRTVDFPMHL